MFLEDLLFIKWQSRVIAEKKASDNRGEKRIVIIVTLFALCYAVDEIS